MEGNPLKKFVPENVAAKVPSDDSAGPRNGRDAFRALSPQNVIGMACNIRNQSVIPGIMNAVAEPSFVVATKRFQREIDKVPAECARGIEDAAHREAFSLLDAFRPEGTVRIAADHLIARV